MASPLPPRRAAVKIEVVAWARRALNRRPSATKPPASDIVKCDKFFGSFTRFSASVGFAPYYLSVRPLRSD